MTGQELLDKLLEYYSSSFDITHPYEIGGDTYEAYAGFNVTSSKYVLYKKAELWRTYCYEHVLFRLKKQVGPEDILRFFQHVVEYMEPQLVRQGERCPQPNHMYSYMTGIFISEQGISPETAREVKKLKFRKNYRFAVRGFSEARIVIFDLENKKIIGNPAAKEVVKGFRKSKGLF